MQQEVKYKVYYEIDNERPHIEIGFKFKDYFETNNYYLVSETASKSIEDLIFEVIKDDKEIGKIRLKDFQTEEFLNDFSNLTKDHDFKKIMISEHQEKVKKDLNSFFDYYKKSILENKFTLEGEIKRMKSVAGII
jgi:hypothetical protein